MTISTRGLAGTALLGGLLLLSGCGTAANASWHAAGNGTDDTGPTTASITGPTHGTNDVPTSSEITFSVTNAAAATVTLKDEAGTAVEGAMRPDNSSWVPARQLKYGTTYTATVTATKASRSGTESVTFTTMRRPGNLVRVSTPLDDDQVYGVAMPVIARFDTPVPKDQRAGVERRLFVTSEPPQLGTWHWFSGTEVHFRPREYWQAGTKLSVRLGVGGQPFGDGAYGAADVTIRASIGEKVLTVTDNATKTMTVTQGNQVLRTMPVSLGKPSTPSPSGHMVVMSKAESELFVSTDPADPYRLQVEWTMRLTTGGIYHHAAPWSVGDQGRRNVSHGCVNLSTANAKWLWGQTRVGDPAIIKGTERKLAWGDGWTDWDVSWGEYLKGSALPAPAKTGPAGSPPAGPSPAPARS